MMTLNSTLLSIWKARLHKTVLSLSVALAVSACATGTPGTLEGEYQGNESLEALFPAQKSQDMFTAAYSIITERYLEHEDIRNLSLEAIRGLAAIDPEIQINLGVDALSVSVGDGPVRKFSFPLSEEPYEWGNLTYEISAYALSQSKELKDSQDEKIYEAVLDSALANFDIFSRYAGHDEAEKNRGRRDGFGGVGINLRQNDGSIIVSRTQPDSPAERAGVRNGDRIVEIDGRLIQNESLNRVGDLLRGDLQTLVTVVVERDKAPRRESFVLMRELIIPQTVFANYDKGVLTLRVSGFNQRTARDVSKRLRWAVRTYGSDFQGTILDLRGNPGGLLDQAVRIVDHFVDEGRIISTKGRHPDSKQLYEASAGDLSEGRPLVILVNGKSASASEIVAASLQDLGRAVLVGSTSFGKGTVQTVQRLPNGGEITLTWSRLLAPSGYVFHGLGVRPSICTVGLAENPPSNIEKVLKVGSDVQSDLSLWHGLKYPSGSVRDKLRSACPSNPDKPLLDQEIARRLLANRLVYEQALEATNLAVAR